jgi:APA family basic amino acid/polyamine antiporter
MVLRRREPERHRPFKTPMIWLVGPTAMAGCALLFVSLGWSTIRLFLAWAIIGLILYFGYARPRSHMAKPQAVS